jgi:predicted ATPase
LYISPWENREAVDDRDRTTTSISTIAGWLEKLGLAQYVPVFAENVVDIDVLFDLTEANLEKLGIPLGDRKRLLKAIASSQQSSRPLTNVTAATVASPRSDAERRHLTVLFCDLVGSTGLAIRQLLGLARPRPVVFLIEDVHWIDATTLETITRTIPLISTAPVFLLITFRPEFMPPQSINDCRGNG